MKEKTPADAFLKLVTGMNSDMQGIPWSITSLSDGSTRLSNGLRYCFVEVTFATGAQYGTEAYGDEAVGLYDAASSYSVQSTRSSEPMMIVA